MYCANEKRSRLDCASATCGSVAKEPLRLSLQDGAALRGLQITQPVDGAIWHQGKPVREFLRAQPRFAPAEWARIPVRRERAGASPASRPLPDEHSLLLSTPRRRPARRRAAHCSDAGGPEAPAP